MSISKKHITFALQKQSNGSTIFAVQALVIMIIKREQYVEALLNKRWNRKVKIITGIRRCGKSFLLSTLYKDYLKSEGVPFSTMLFTLSILFVKAIFVCPHSIRS